MTQRFPSNVLVTGASGRTGRELLELLRETTLHVRALTRSTNNHESLLADGADEVVIGDLLDRADAQEAVENCDAILFAAGSSLSTGFLRPNRVVDGDGVIALVEAADEAGVRRFILQSSIGVGDSRPGMPLWARLLVLRWTVREKERAEESLRDSDLEHVIVRPGWLTDDPATDDLVLAEGGGPMTGSVPRADVARLMVAALLTPAATGRTFEVVARESATDVDPRTRTSIEWKDGEDSAGPPSHV